MSSLISVCPLKKSFVEYLCSVWIPKRSVKKICFLVPAVLRDVLRTLSNI